MTIHVARPRTKNNYTVFHRKIRKHVGFPRKTSAYVLEKKSVYMKPQMLAREQQKSTVLHKRATAGTSLHQLRVGTH